LKEFFSSKDPGKYMLQEYLDLEKDIRVVVLGNKILGSINRKVNLKRNKGYQGIKVKASGKCSIPKETEKACIKISKKIGSDFCGIDIGIDKKGSAYFMECNISPQFISSEKTLSMNIAEKLMDLIIKKSR